MPPALRLLVQLLVGASGLVQQSSSANPGNLENDLKTNVCVRVLCLNGFDFHNHLCPVSLHVFEAVAPISSCAVDALDSRLSRNTAALAGWK